MLRLNVEERDYFGIYYVAREQRVSVVQAYTYVATSNIVRCSYLRVLCGMLLCDCAVNVM